MRTDEVKNDELGEIRKSEEKIERKDLIFKTNKCKHDFQQYETIRSFGHNIYAGTISIDEAEMDQTNLLENIIKFNHKSKQKNKKKVKVKNEIFLMVEMLFMKANN